MAVQNAVRAGLEQELAQGTERISSRSPTPSRGVADLPDLTERLQEYGIYGEYIKFRKNYLEWRSGGSRGARGELTNQELTAQSNDPNRFEYWYPTASIFKWRFTAAYWASIASLLGSILFTYSAGVLSTHSSTWTEEALHAMVRWPNFWGGWCFVVGMSCLYLQLVNVDTDDAEHATIFKCPDWSAILKKVHMDSCLGTMAFFIGALLFQVGATAALFAPTGTVKLVFKSGPYVLGSVLFVVGAVCEVRHNRIGCRGGATVCEPVWWASMCNLVGSILFLVGSIPAIVPAWSGPAGERVEAVSFFWGSVLFVVSSIMLMLMWEANNFGLALLHQLNFAGQAKGAVRIETGRDGAVNFHLQMPTNAAQAQVNSEASRRSFSVRGLAFLLIYCWFICAACLVSIVQCLQYEHAQSKHKFQLAASIFTQIFVMCMVLLMLVIHAAVVRAPKIQPFRCALYAIRVLFFFGATAETLLLGRWQFVRSDYDGPPAMPAMQGWVGQIII